MNSVKYAPFIHSKQTSSYMNAGSLISLLPCAAFSVFRYGLRALILIVLCGALACGLKYVFDLLRKTGRQPQSAPVVAGILFALMLPPDTPAVAAAVGVVFMIAVVYEMFGGIGCNVVNGAVASRLFVEVIWPSHFRGFNNSEKAWLDMSTLVSWKHVYFTDMPSSDGYHLSELLAGGYPGFIGTGSVLMIIIGLIYLIRTRSVKFYAPAAYIIVVMASRLAVHFNDGLRSFATFMIISSVLFVAVFILTDRTTVPQTGMGGLITGAVCGALTVALFEMTSGIYALLVPVIAVNMVSGLVEYLTSYSAERHEHSGLRGGEA